MGGSSDSNGYPLENTESVASGIVELIGNKVRRTYTITFYCYLVPVISVLYLVMDLIEVSHQIKLITLVVVTLSSNYWFFESRYFRLATNRNILEHVNRSLSAYQESA